MAIKVDAGEVSRVEIMGIYPEFLVFDQKDNSRATPHSDEEIEALAQSILEHGQLQPILARKVEGNKVKVVAGYGRATAIHYINQVLRPDKPMKVLVRVTDMNAEEAFVKSIAENLERSATGPVDDAHAQRRLREDYGWTDAKIAEFYKKSVSYIGSLKKVLTLSGPIQEEIKANTLPVTTAIILADVPEGEREQVLAESKGADGKVSTEKVKQKVREVKVKSGKGGTGRSLKELREFFTGLTGPAEGEALRYVSSQFLRFMGGEIQEAAMTRVLEKWLKEPEPKVTKAPKEDHEYSLA